MERSQDCFVKPRRCHGEPEISGTVLFCVNPGEAQSVVQAAVKLGGQRHFLYNSSLVSIPASKAYACGPALGAPMAVMTLEKLIALGGRRFVVFGTCGALIRDLSLGEVLMPQWAVSSEGTSRHYPLSIPPRVSSRLHALVCASLIHSGIEVKAGGVWTTDAPFRETRAQVVRLQQQAVAGVDMEFSALLTVAAFREVELVAVMVVSDLLSGDDWLPGFGAKAFKASVRRVSQSLIDFCVKDSHE
ncbi:MAG: nucleoside phosphorylase [Proteobacteria bacterium]|nr:nucleoside phosphorylase [Desulfobulbaceae bacterium]MBU4153460.1 nucleoside phosphorylase [Pseudomonadota bacterium]